MLDFINDKKNCTGCSACVNICPVNCISMKEDEKGFLYPSADDRCINCDKCRDVCPIYNNETEKKPNLQQHASAAVTKDINVWKKSTSGGAFTEICNIYGDEETIIYGATFENKKVIHTSAVGVKNIDIFRKSKYVQSDLKNTFNEAKKCLENGKRVIFSGTPCQIAGLRSYLSKDYRKLLCIDLICHGVGSPKVFSKYLDYLNEQYKSNLVNYTFRYKKVLFGNFENYLSKYEFSDGNSDFVFKDEYNEMFLSQLCLRDSCQSNCQFRNVNRMGDITIADFKAKRKIFPNLIDYRNYSTIVVNTKKGNEVYNDLNQKMDIYPCDIEDIKKYNPLFYRTTKGNAFRNDFFDDFENGMKMKNLISKYVSRKDKSIKDHIKKVIPFKVKMIINKIWNLL